MEHLTLVKDELSQQQRTQISYRTALTSYRKRSRLARISWMTWIITVGTIGVWCVTAYQAALAAEASGFQSVLANVAKNAITIQDNDALTTVLVAFGAKENDLIHQGQYWRFVTPIFLHANALHIGLNMLNLVVLGIFLERLAGHYRFVLIYLVTGVVSIMTSFYFVPQEISVGASGAIFGLVGAYSVFVLIHRRAFSRGGIPALLWLVLIIGANLGVGFVIPNVDNYAHIGGLVSGCVLGWWFMPLYRVEPEKPLKDAHSLARRWPLALLTLLGTLVLAIIAVHFSGG